MTPAFSLFGVGLLAAIGLGLVRQSPALRSRSVFYQIGAGYLVGVAAVSGTAYLLSHFLHVPLRRPFIASLFLVGLIVATSTLFRRRRTASPAPSRSAPGPLSLLTLAIGAAVSLGLFANAVSQPSLDWDGRVIWNAHARYVRAAASVDAPTLRDIRWAVEVPRHPLLLPVTQVVLQELFGVDDDDRFIRPLYAAFFPAFLLVLFYETRKRAGVLAAALTTSAAALVPQLGFELSGASGSYSDLPLACFWGAGLLMLLYRRNDVECGALSGLLLGAALLTKNEGAPLALIALGAGIIFHARRVLKKKGRSFWSALAPALVATLGVSLAAVLLVSWRGGIANRLDPNFDSALRVATVTRQFGERFPGLLRYMLQKMNQSAAWGGFWWIAAFAFVAGRRLFRRPSSRGLFVAVAAALASYLVAYSATRLNPPAFVGATWNRFLLQLLLPTLVLFGMALREILRRPRSRIESEARRSGALELLAVLVLIAASPAAEIAGLSLVPVPPPPQRSLLPSMETGERMPSLTSAQDDPSLPASIDEPAESAKVEGELLVRGWSQDTEGPAEVLEIQIDGVTRSPVSFKRVGRPDVEKALPQLGSCDQAGYEARFVNKSGGVGIHGELHEIRIFFLSAKGTVRSLRRSFSWS